jgi:hypothetical protein
LLTETLPGLWKRLRSWFILRRCANRRRNWLQLIYLAQIQLFNIPSVAMREFLCSGVRSWGFRVLSTLSGVRLDWFNIKIPYYLSMVSFIQDFCKKPYFTKTEVVFPWFLLEYSDREGFFVYFSYLSHRYLTYLEMQFLRAD